MEKARPATTRDHAVLTRLLAAALTEAVAVRGGPALVGDATPEGLLQRWTAAATAERAQLSVGEFDGAVVGLVAVSVRPAPTGAAPRGLVECCYVEPAGRGVGVGAALLAAALTWCEVRGCDEVDALALPGDRSTKQRLEGAGFSARLLTLSRRLG
jgi:aminoglycoside 6'-N-acetyltransferase I